MKEWELSIPNFSDFLLNPESLLTSKFCVDEEISMESFWDEFASSSVSEIEDSFEVLKLFAPSPKPLSLI